MLEDSTDNMPHVPYHCPFGASVTLLLVFEDSTAKTKIREDFTLRSVTLLLVLYDSTAKRMILLVFKNTTASDKRMLIGFVDRHENLQNVLKL